MTVKRIAAGAAACCAVMLVAGCGAGTSATGNATVAPTAAAPANGSRGAAGGAPAFPGATGLLAQINGQTLQVQGTSAQTAVTYSASTTFTNTLAAKPSDIVVGVCVQARSARPAAGAGGAAPTTAPRVTGAIVAATVEISPSVNGSCAALAGVRMSGARPPGAAGAPGMPSSGRTRGSGGAGNGFGGLGAFGKVTAVSAASFTLQSTPPQGATATSPVPTSQTVQTPAATTYTRTGAATAKALVIGLCVTALGKADDTGSIAATSIALRPAQNGSCSSGFAGGFGGRGPAGGTAAPAGGAGA